MNSRPMRKSRNSHWKNSMSSQQQSRMLCSGWCFRKKVATDWIIQVRTLLLANGSSLDTVDNLTIEDARHLYSALRLGLWGPFIHYRTAYYGLTKQNEIAEILRATAMGKKFKPSQFPSYAYLFPHIRRSRNIGAGDIDQEIQEAIRYGC